MLKRRLRFGPSAEQEDRFRPAHLEAVEWDRRLAVGDDRLLRFLTPQRLWFLPPGWCWGSEEALRQANEQLEEKIRERTEELLALNENLTETRDQLRSLASLLEKEPGFEVVGLAEDGLEAVRLAREVRPDVVLMDINMPKMDGIEATRQITADLPEIKVIGLSVHADQQVVSETLAAGATSFVPKSSSPEELTEAIRTVMRTGPPASGPQ